MEGGGLVRGLVGVGGSTSQGIGDGETYRGQQEAWARQYPQPPMAPRQPLAPGFAGSLGGWPPTLGSPYQRNFQGRHPINGLSGLQEAQPPGDRPQRLLCSADAAVVPRHFESLADKHLAALREGPLASWYSPSPPNRLAALLTVIVSVALLIVITGIIIGDSYEHKDKDKGDSSSYSRTSSTESSAWLARELRKRKDEAKEPETTEKRVAKENKDWEDKLAKRPDREREKYMKERTKDVDLLRESLRNSGLPLVALDVPGLKKANARARSKDEKKVTKAEGGTGEKKSFGLALKRVFLGRQLADALERRKAESRPEEGTAVVTTMLRSQVTAEGGPGWKAADDAVAHAAVSSGAARAEALAKRMAAEKAGAA